MCWPEIVGGVEVEERRPRTWNEPRRKHKHRRGSDEWQPAELTERETPKSTFFPLPFGPFHHEKVILEWSTEYLAPSRDEAKFLAFLSLYGSSGVPLRELIMLATLRTSVNPSKNHWLLSGERGPIFRATGPVTLPAGPWSLPANCSFLNAFVRETSHSLGLDGLQKRLLSMGLIVVEPPPKNSPHFDGTWCTDERIWCIAKNEMSSHLMVSTWGGSDGEGIIMDLLYVFLEMPSKDVNLFAERHRETFYYHARLFALETLRFHDTILKNVRDYIVWLILQLLTHRYQDGDEKLLLFARAWPSYVNGSDWAIMLLSAELKEVNFRRASRMKTTLTNRITSLLSWKGRRQRRANGLIGYLLVEWMKATEATREFESTSQIVKFAADWVESAWSSGSSIESVALCGVLATFRILDRSVLVSPKYHLFYGHNLSRAGHLEQARKFLTSGIEYLRPSLHPSRQLLRFLWGYEFELVSVLIRLGLLQEAKQRLRNIQILATHRNRDEQDVGKQLGEHAEIRILLDLYYSECFMAGGTVINADHRLDTPISTVSLVHDGHVRSLRLALEMRLLEHRTWQGSLDQARQTAENLVIETSDESLSSDMVQWITQQLLVLSNRLAWAGNASAASSLLGNISQICRYKHYSDSLKDLLPYAEQRRATFEKLLIIDHAKSDPTAVGYESNAATNEPLAYLEGPSSKAVSLTRKAMSDSADLIATASPDFTRATTKRSLLDPWSPWNMRTSGTENESMEESKVPNPATDEPSKKVPFMEPTRRVLEKRPASKRFMKQGPRRSLAAMLSRAPRAPNNEPGISFVESRGKGPKPVSTEPPVLAELATT